MHQFDSDQLEAAAQRLEADEAEAARNHSRERLVHRLVREIRHLATGNRGTDWVPAVTRTTHALGYGAIDGALATAMREIGASAGPAALLIAERWHAKFIVLAAEADAHVAEQGAARDAAAHAARMAPLFEAQRANIAAQTAAPVIEALRLFRDRAADIERRLHGRAIGDEDSMTAALDDLADALRSLTTSAGIVRRESRLRRSAAEAEAAVSAAIAA